MNENYKARKEAFVSDHTGGPVSEIVAVTLVPTVGGFLVLISCCRTLWQYLQGCRSMKNVSRNSWSNEYVVGAHLCIRDQRCLFASRLSMFVVSTGVPLV